MKRPALLWFAFTVAGCAYQSTGVYERPDGTAFNTPHQMRIASASHWKTIANNEAQLLGQRLTGMPILVEKNNISNFSETYHNLLTSSLVSNGSFVLTENRYDNVKVSYNVNVVTNHAGHQTADLASHKKGGIGLAIFAYYILNEAIGLAKLPPLLASEQMIKNLSSATEVVITTRATQDSQVLYSASNVYYIEGLNKEQYIENKTGSTNVPAFTAGESVYKKIVGD